MAIVTGFFIPDSEPPAGETDGPLGALFLARGLASLGARAVILSDTFCIPALAAGLDACGLGQAIPLVELPAQAAKWDRFLAEQWLPAARHDWQVTHLLAIERPGPSHTLESIRAQPVQPKDREDALARFAVDVPPEHRDRCHRMSGIDISHMVSPAHRLFESASSLSGVTTIGIGDGGNEIGMGKIPWDVIRQNIPKGAWLACRIATEHLIVCGVSNWGAYGLVGGIHAIRGISPEPSLFSPEREYELLKVMVERGPLVDGVTKAVAPTVDGLTFERYVEPLRRIGEMLERR